MISPSAFMRPDIAQLVYAQWTIRVSHEFCNLSKLSPRRRMPVVKLTPAVEPESHTGASQDTPDTILLDVPTHRPPLCVLFFRNGLMPLKQNDVDLKPIGSTLNVDIDITGPDLPSFENHREHGVKTVQVRRGKKAVATLPMYDMSQLFSNHPQGLLAIQRACSSRPLDLHAPGQDPQTQWVGIVESSLSLPIATGLWKLASLLPKPDTIISRTR